MSNQTQNSGSITAATKTPIEVTILVKRGDTEKRFIVNGQPADQREYWAAFKVDPNDDFDIEIPAVYHMRLID